MEKISPQHQDHSWGAMVWLAEGETLGASLARMTVRAGATSPAHRHRNCNEAIHVLSGEIAQRCDDEWVILKSGETITVPAGVIHQTRNRGAGDATLMICYSSGSRDYQEIEA
ncbi:MAG: cupin domain-containing protein [Pseudomonadota bacterium]